jgi:hypothetical protein
MVGVHPNAGRCFAKCRALCTPASVAGGKYGERIATRRFRPRPWHSMVEVLDSLGKFLSDLLERGAMKLLQFNIIDVCVLPDATRKS